MAEVVSLEQQRFSGGLRQGIREAVSEVQVEAERAAVLVPAS
jgi:hypothetical protein